MLEEVIIVMKIEGVIVDIRKEGLSEILKKELSVQNRRRRIEVDGKEIEMKVDKRVENGKIMRNKKEGIIDRRIEMRVIIKNEIKKKKGRIEVGEVIGEINIVNGMENEKMKRIKEVEKIGKREDKDKDNGIIKIRKMNLIDNGNRINEDWEEVWEKINIVGKGWRSLI